MSDPEYKVHPPHRNGNPRKSQWTISEPDEIECFRAAFRNNWRVGATTWGLHLVEQQPDWLGVSKDRANRLFIAKFVSDAKTGPWHGYPADYRNNQHDIPSESILGKWLMETKLSAAKIRKIARGQPCSL